MFGKFFWGIVAGIVVSSRGAQFLLGSKYYDQYIADPIKDKVDVFDLWDGDSGEVGSASFDVGDAYAKYEEIYRILDEQYIEDEDVQLSQMHDNALRAFVEALDDPHTSYLNVEESSSFGEAIQGSQNFEGIGAVVGKKKDGIMIEEVLKGSPAFQAGLQALDLVVKIEGELIDDLSLFEAVELIRGPKGTDVNLTVFREKEENIFDVAVTRDTIDVPSVSIEYLDSTTVVFSGVQATGIQPLLDSQNVLYIEIATFGEDTATKLKQELSVLSRVPDGVVLDLRGNGGGILPIAVDIAGFFLPVGKLVTRVDYATFPDEEFDSSAFDLLVGVPVVVLIDQMSASASEILAGALRDHVGAILVGQSSFGKGSVQTIMPLRDGSSLKFSIGKWYTPDGTNVNDTGLAPDVEVSFSRDMYLDTGYDAQLEEALKQLLITE